MSVDKLVDSAQLDADLTSVANAIRTKGGTSAQLAFPAGFVSAVQAIPSGGGGVTYDEIVSTTTSLNSVVLTKTTVKAYTLAGFSAITSVSSQTVTTIKEYAFFQCTGLQTIDLPALTTLQGGTATSPSAAVSGCFFQYCSAIRSVNLPNLTNVYGQYAFASAGHSSCVWVLPKLTVAAPRLFASSQSRLFDFGVVSQLLTDAFYNGANKTVILRRTEGVVTAASKDTIKNITTVYVPSALVSSYQTATNWSTRYTAGTLSILPIENSIYENAYADGTPIT